MVVDVPVYRSSIKHQLRSNTSKYPDLSQLKRNTNTNRSININDSGKGRMLVVLVVVVVVAVEVEATAKTNAKHM